MPVVQLFALILGIVYLAVGILGFIPPALAGSVPGAMGPFEGFLLGIFAVNWFHNLVHILIGIAGLAVFRSFQASRMYALVIGVAYAGVFLLGILWPGMATLGGLLPLNAADNVLHIATAIVAIAVYFTTRVPERERGATEPRS